MRGYIQANSLSLPMDIMISTRSVFELASFLGCLEGPLEAHDVKRETTVDLEGYEFGLPLRWLATMIMRFNSADINDLLENIVAMRYLGDLNEAALAEYKEHRISDTITFVSKAQACEPGCPNQSGF